MYSVNLKVRNFAKVIQQCISYVSLALLNIRKKDDFLYMPEVQVYDMSLLVNK